MKYVRGGAEWNNNVGVMTMCVYWVIFCSVGLHFRFAGVLGIGVWFGFLFFSTCVLFAYFEGEVECFWFVYTCALVRRRLEAGFAKTWRVERVGRFLGPLSVFVSMKF